MSVYLPNDDTCCSFSNNGESLIDNRPVSDVRCVASLMTFIDEVEGVGVLLDESSLSLSLLLLVDVDETVVLMFLLWVNNWCCCWMAIRYRKFSVSRANCRWAMFLRASMMDKAEWEEVESKPSRQDVSTQAERQVFMSPFSKEWATVLMCVSIAAVMGRSGKVLLTAVDVVVVVVAVQGMVVVVEQCFLVVVAIVGGSLEEIRFITSPE